MQKAIRRAKSRVENKNPTKTSQDGPGASAKKQKEEGGEKEGKRKKKLKLSNVGEVGEGTNVSQERAKMEEPRPKGDAGRGPERVEKIGQPQSGEMQALRDGEGVHSLPTVFKQFQSSTQQTTLVGESH